ERGGGGSGARAAGGRGREPGRPAGVAARRTGRGSRGYGLRDGGAGAAACGAGRGGRRGAGAAVPPPWPAGASPPPPVRPTRPARRAPGGGALRRRRPSPVGARPAGRGQDHACGRLPTVMPLLDRAAALEVTSIHSVAGTLPVGSPLMTEPPFCAPHH